MFLDRAKIQVRAGNGGNGCVSFRREKFIPRGGPDGGDGGRGGSVILKADPSVSTLNDFHHKQHFRAEKGKHGEGSNRTGRDGNDLIIHVPAGTVLLDDEEGRVLADLCQAGEQFTAAAGGRGGRGNARFATATHQAPRDAEGGREGESFWLRLELRVLADVGLVGLPNVGKSTLLSRMTSARPKVAAYPFTTLTPHLGVAELSPYRTTVMADIPGLIQGAHSGAGLGDRFLQHLRRTRLLLHLVDGATDPDRDPLEDYRTIRRELAAHGAGLESRPELVLVSRADLLQDETRLEGLSGQLAAQGRPLPVRVSGVTGEGLDELRRRLQELLDTLPDAPEAIDDGGEEREVVLTLREKRR